MHLINDIHLVFSLCGTVGNLLPDLTDVVDTVVGCRIDLDHIHGCSRLYRPTGRALVTWTAVHRLLTVDRFCKNLCHGRFTGSTGSTEQKCVTDTVRTNLIF